MTKAKHSATLRPFEEALILAYKASYLLIHSRSWMVLGIRIVNRLFPRDQKIHWLWKMLFYRSCLWVELKMKSETGTPEEILTTVKTLCESKNVFFDYHLSEFSIDHLLNKIEKRSPKGFDILFKKKVEEYRRKKNDGRLEIDISFHLSEVPKKKFFIDAENFSFMLPVYRLYEDKSYIRKKNDYLHKFSQPTDLFDSATNTYEILIEGESIWQVPNVNLFNGYQTINSDQYLCYDKSADPSNLFIAGYTNAMPSFRTIGDRDYVKLNLKNYQTESLDQIFLLSGRCTRNYFHWLIEYLPKLMWMNETEVNSVANLQIAVDSQMPRQHYEALNYFMKILQIPNPTIMINPDKTIYNVKNLFVSSNPTYIPDCVDKFSYSESSALNVDCLSKYRNLLLQGVNNTPTRRLYLARSNKLNRKLVNEDSLIDLFVEYGFEVVYPESLNFEEQIQLFNSAQFIVGPTGASFSNIIFCQKGTTVLNFIASENRESALFANLGRLAGVNYYFATGKLIKNRNQFTSRLAWLFSDFEIDIEKLRSHLDEFFLLQKK